ncbi:type VII secretion protein EccB [Nonomuraea phyllanthi]|uniref:type VII secretion protein EccB n=1 Tax=Nonomuraea phyllanthi TaxID=2219224 RepID=UPI001292EE50|nr:type VII secretion protein EccB [Nonomuraea phyllanthi]QFY06299.1 type VII secretion protein EccB [Nonomuraea phyllanthi]
MQTSKDLYQAHKLMQQRMGMALLQAEPDVTESPMRRLNTAMLIGLVLAVVVAAGFGIWGLIKPGNATKLTDPGQLLVEEETGATYVYSQQDGKLLPVANYVSGRLLLDGSAEVKSRNVTAASLAQFSRGKMVGIPGAPATLPDKKRLVRGPWSVCVSTDASGRPYVSLVGGQNVGGAPVDRSTAMVVGTAQQTFVVWNNEKFEVPQQLARVVSNGGRPRQMPASWLNAIPTGPPFATPSIPGRGKSATAPGGRRGRIGQIYAVPAVAGAEARWYVLLADGLAPIGNTQAELLRQDPASKAAYGKNPVTMIQIDAATANATPLSKTDLRVGGLPTTMPKMMSPAPSSPLCAVYADADKGSMRATITVGNTLPLPAPRSSDNAQENVSQVLLPPGGAALVGLLPGEGQLTSIANYYLITDQGRRFGLPTADVLGKLGYTEKDAAPLPSHLIHLVPPGPDLDPAAARNPVQVTASNTQP